MRVSNPERARAIMAEIKTLRSREDTLREKLKEINLSYQSQISEIRNQIRPLQQELDGLKLDKKVLIETDHAVLRYLERVKGVNVEEARQVLRNDKLRKQFEQLGDGRYPLDDCVVIIENSTIKTVIGRDK